MGRGDQVTAMRNQDGSWTLRGMRVFAVVPKGANKNKTGITKEWLAEAVARGRQRMTRDGYRAPLHVGHTSRGTKMGAGTFVPTHVELAEYDGRMLPHVFVEARVPEWAYKMIKAGELPFRSVEIDPTLPPEIFSLALMNETVPFFRFGCLGVGEELDGEPVAAVETTVTQFAAADRPLIAFAAVGKRRLALFEALDESFGEKKKKPKHEDDGDDEPDEDAPEEEFEDDDDADVIEEDEEELELGDDEIVGDEDQAGEEPGDEAGGGKVSIRKKVDGILAVLSAIWKRLNGEDGAPNAPSQPVEMEVQDLGEAEEESDDMAKPVQKITKKALLTEFSAAMTSALQPIATRLDALEGKTSAQETAATAAAATRTRLDAAKTKLRGRFLTAADEADLAEFAAAGDGPLNRFVGAIERRPLQSPDTRSAEEVFGGGSDAGGAGEPAEVAEYAAKGADKHAKAKQLARSFDHNKQFGMTCSLKEYLAANIDSGLMKPVAR